MSIVTNQTFYKAHESCPMYLYFKKKKKMIFLFVHIQKEFSFK